VDAYGKMELRHVCHLLKRNGTYASTLFIPPPYLSMILIRLIFGKKLKSANIRRHPEDWKEIESLFAEGKLKPLLENVFSLEKAADAFELAEKGSPRGKIIVTV
jgi:NADPH:quinone reductase-like Zn-dependent oxidoreductase